MVVVILRWLLAGIVTVVVVSAAAVATSGANIAADLTGRATGALPPDFRQWAEVTFDGREARLSGTATDPAEIADAISRVAAIHGVRNVVDGTSLAPLASPYPFIASIVDDRVSVSGGVPSRALAAEIAAEAGAGAEGLTLLSGAPDRARWRAAISFALNTIQLLDDGKVELADLALSVSGRARSQAALETLSGLGESAPQGVVIAGRDIVPPFVAPYTWSASYDGASLAVSGYAPDAQAIESMRRAVKVPVSTDLLLASGAPSEFALTTQRVLVALASLERGTATISDGELTLAGAPPTSEVAQAVTESLDSANSIITLEPPRVSPYVFTASRQDESLILGGYAPDTQTRQRLIDAGGDAANLALARGEPEHLDAAIDFGLAVLARMSGGRFSLADDTMTIEGRAATSADYRGLLALLAEGPPRGVVLAASDVRPPIADPFVWAANRGRSGSITIEGFVPSEEVRARLGAVAGLNTADHSEVADGAPDDFTASAEAGLAALAKFDRGDLSLDHGTWGLVATTSSHEVPDAALGALRAAVDTANWTFAITAPPPLPPIADPYLWSATKAADGTFALAGNVANEGFRQFLSTRLGGLGADAMTVARGAPQGFAAHLLAGLDALTHLNAGTVAFDGTQWTLSGLPQTTADAEAATGVVAQVDGAPGIWRTDLAAPVIPPPPPPPPVADPYLWSAQKSADGEYALAGNVPNEGFHQFLVSRLGSVGSDTMTVARGAPTAFATDLLAGLDALARLNAGVVSYDGTTWSLSGVPQTQDDADASLAALAAANTPAPDWRTDLAPPVIPLPPEPALAAPEPVVASEPEPAVPSDPEPALAREPEAAVAAEPEAVVAPEPDAVVAAEPEAAIASEPEAAVAPAPQEADAAPAMTPEPPAPSAEAETIAAAPAAEGPEAPVVAATDPAAGAQAPSPESASAAEPAPETGLAPLAAPEPLSADLPAAPEEAPSTPAGTAVAADVPDAPAIVEPAPAEPLVAAIPPAETAPPVAAPPVADEAPVAPPAPPVPPVSVAAREVPEETPPAAEVPFGTAIFDASRSDGGPVTLTGVVPTTAAAGYLGLSAGEVATDQLRVADTLPPGFVANAAAGLRALQHLVDGRLAYDGRTWIISGTADSEADREASVDGFVRLPEWRTDVALTPPLDICRRELAAFSARNSILFQSGKAAMTADSATALDELAADLARCPQAAINVEGHTDADGPDDLNLALSVARAEAVVDALITMGIGPERLYAVGYGESLPVASNDTTAGKQANRRIVFSIVGPGQ